MSMRKAEAKREERAAGTAEALADLPGGRLKGHVAVVTGADSGIGQAIAIAYAKEGADVVVAVHEDRQGAEETAQQVRDAGRRVALLDLEQRDPDSVKRFFSMAKEEVGVPTILVNNAGIDSTGRHVKDMRLEDMENEIRTNFLGPFYCTHAFLRMLDESGKGGAIVNITRVHQEIPRAGAAGYDCAKGALRNLTTTLALELAETGVRVKGA